MDITTLNRRSLSPATLARHAELYADGGKSLAELVRVEDPAFYVDPWPVYERLHQEAPAYYYEPFDTWIITKYEDVRYISRTPETFSAAHGILLMDAVKKGAGAQDVFAGDGDFIGLTDPPRHNELRRIMQPPFTPPALARLQTHIEEYCDRLLDPIEPGSAIDWVDAVAARLPVLVIASILGIAEGHEEFFDNAREWSDAVEDLASKDLTTERLAEVKATFASLDEYIGHVFDEKRRCPDDGFLSSLLGDELDGKKLTEANLIGFTQALMAAGSDTVRALLSEMVAHLATFPDQRRLLAADPGLAPQAVEEVLRFASPARAFARQVVQDTTVRGEHLKTGQRVLLAYDAANRDAEAFDSPHFFDVRQERGKRNVAFGFGTHVCIAAPLARAEAATLLVKVLQRFPEFEIAGAGHRVESFLRNGWSDLPVVFQAK